MEHVKSHSDHLTFGVALLALAGLFSKLYFIFSPRYIMGDGAIYLMMARDLLAGNWHSGLGNFQGPMLPLLTAAVSLTGLSPHRSALLVNSLLASLILFPFSRLLKMLRLPAGFILAACACFLFYPRWFQFSTMALTEVLFGTLLIFAADALRGELRVPGIITLSILAVAAYMTKTEGLLLFALIPLCILFNAAAFRHPAGTAFTRIAIFAITAILLSLPYLLHLKSLAGEWCFSPKAANAAVQRSDENADINRYSLDSAGRFKPMPMQPLLSPADRLRIFQANTPYFLARMPKTIAWPLFVLWMAGLLVFPFRRYKEDPNPAFVALWFFSITYLVFYSFFFISFRFYVPCVPLAMLWAAYFIFTFADLSRFPLFDWIAVIFTGVLIYFSLALAQKERLRSPFSRMDAGAWAAASLAHEKIIALHGTDLNYYFNLKTSQLPYTDADGLYRYSKLNGAAYLLLGDYDIEDKDCKRPMLEKIFAGEDARFAVMKEFARSGQDRYRVFAIKEPAPPTTPDDPGN